MKRMLCVLIALLLMAVPCLAMAESAQAQAVRVASLKGPTSMGLVKLMKDGEASGQYSFTVAGTADEIVPLMAKGELDIALVPCNLASVLFSKLEGGVAVAAINTLGVLYIVENGDTVNSVEDLRGQTLYSTGKGTTPEYALNYVLSENGIDPATGLTIEYKSESTEVAAALDAGTVNLAMLPQPYVTTVLTQNPDLRVALDLTEEWNAVNPQSALITGVVLLRRPFMEENPDAVDAFLQDYAASTDYVNANPAEASVWIEELGIAKAAVAEKAIPACNIVCITGEEMREKVSAYLDVLAAQDPASVGGSVPDDTFYYIG